jgi:hypothetical protein
MFRSVRPYILVFRNFYKVWKTPKRGSTGVVFILKNCTENQVVTIVLAGTAEDIARWYNPKLQGWINYYGKYSRSALYPMLRHFNMTLVAWAMRKHKRFRHRKTWAAKFLEGIAEENPQIFVHWRKGMKGAFA